MAESSRVHVDTDLDGINDAFDRMRAGEGLRTVVEFK
jgi:Zn-dependent alcohol dehydrogenase